VKLLFKYVLDANPKLKPTQLDALSQALPDLVDNCVGETITFMSSLELASMGDYVLKTEAHNLPHHANGLGDANMLLVQSSSAYNGKIFHDVSSHRGVGDNVPVVAKLVTIPGLANEKILTTFANSKDPELFNNPVVKAVLQCVWDQMIYRAFLEEFLMFVILMVTFLVFSVVVASQEDANDDLEDLWMTWTGLITGICDIIMIFLGMYFVFAELNRSFDLDSWKCPKCPRCFSRCWSSEDELAEEGVDAESDVSWMQKFWSKMGMFANDPFILIALFGFTLLIVIPILHICRFEGLREVSAVASVLVIFNSLTYMQGFSSMGPLVRNFKKIMFDIRHFLILLVLIMLGFTNAFNLMFSQSNMTEFARFDNTFMSTFGMMLGSFDLSWFKDSAEKDLMNVIFILYIVLVNIVLLNMLIAIMGETYARVSEKAPFEFQQARATLIVQFLKKKPLEEREMKTFKWIYALVPSSDGMGEVVDDQVELKTLNDSLVDATKKLDQLAKLLKQK